MARFSLGNWAKEGSPSCRRGHESRGNQTNPWNWQYFLPLVFIYVPLASNPKYSGPVSNTRNHFYVVESFSVDKRALLGFFFPSPSRTGQLSRFKCFQLLSSPDLLSSQLISHFVQLQSRSAWSSLQVHFPLECGELPCYLFPRSSWINILLRKPKCVGIELVYDL